MYLHCLETLRQRDDGKTSKTLRERIDVDISDDFSFIRNGNGDSPLVLLFIVFVHFAIASDSFFK